MLKTSISGGKISPLPEDAFMKQSFVIRKRVSQASVNFDDMIVPAVVAKQKIAVGTYEEPINGGLGSEPPRDIVFSPTKSVKNL